MILCLCDNMVYCQHDKNKTGQCKKTGGKCILNNPKTVTDFGKCPSISYKNIGKDFEDMNDYEKLLTRVNKRDKEIVEISLKSEKMMKIINDIRREVSSYGVKFEKIDKRLKSHNIVLTGLDNRLYGVENDKKLPWYRRFMAWLP